MSEQHAHRRRSPPLAAWLLVGVLAIAIAAQAWLQFRQVEVLRAELESVQVEVQALRAALVAVKSTAMTQETPPGELDAGELARQMAEIQAALTTADESQQIEDLKTLLAELQARVDAQQVVLNDLAAESTAREPATGDAVATPHSDAQRLPVARQQQSHNLSCESSAASMVARFLGVPLSEAEVLSALPLNDNPHLGFRGNVDGPTGGIEDYGVYAEPIAEVLKTRGLRVQPVVGGLAGIKAALDRGNPVIAWVTYNCLPSTPVKVVVGDELVTLVPNQHTVVVTGYNADGVWANDPWDGQEDFYPTADLKRAMGYFGDMALEVSAP